MGKVITFRNKRVEAAAKDLDTLAELQKRFSTGLDENDQVIEGSALTRVFADFINLQKNIEREYKVTSLEIHRELVKRGALPKGDEEKENGSDDDPGPNCA